jgi:hypothetical protein
LFFRAELWTPLKADTVTTSSKALFTPNDAPYLFFSPEQQKSQPATPEMFTKILLELKENHGDPKCKTKLSFTSRPDAKVLPPSLQ